MKKFIATILFSLFAFIVSAQTISFETTSFTHKEYRYGRWTDWSPYERSSMLLTLNLDKDIVTIYSPVTQYYYITSYDGTYTNRDGETTIQYSFIDQDGDRGTMRLMQRRSGKSEIYINFNNVIWVYSVIRL